MKITTSLKIAIVGTGNLAFHLAKHLDKSDVELSVVSRNTENGEVFIKSTGISADLVVSKKLTFPYDFVILAVSDDAIEECARNYSFHQESIVLHTSGSQDMSVLKTVKNYGVLYPIQTFSKAKEIDFSTIPLLIEGNAEQTLDKIKMLASLLSTNVKATSSEHRLKVHLAAVFACNFTNHMYQIAEDLLKETGMNLSSLESLIDETKDKAVKIGPHQAQTGPAVRKDFSTMNKHIKSLENNPDLVQLYQSISAMIQKSHE